MWIAYALAADNPQRVSRVVLVEALVPGLSDSPPLLMPKGAVNRQFHFAFNRLESLNEQLVEGREHLFLRMPVLTIAGAGSIAEAVGASLAPLADDLRSVIIERCGHYVAEEAPQEALSVLTEFLAPYATEHL
jgi:pimeloyl-ACP methyl ester carboxylesterase